MSLTRKKSDMLGPWKLFTLTATKVQELYIFLHGTKEEREKISNPEYPKDGTGNGYKHSLMPISWEDWSGEIHDEPHQSIRSILGKDPSIAHEILAKYIKQHGVNISNRYDTTLLHHLAFDGYLDLLEHVLAQPDFSSVNFICTSWPAQTINHKLCRISEFKNLTDVLHASALDMAIQYWLEGGGADLKPIELLLQYGATPPSHTRDFVYSQGQFGDDVLGAILGYQGKSSRTQDELVALFCLLSRYGWDAEKEFQAFPHRAKVELPKPANAGERKKLEQYLLALEELKVIERRVLAATAGLEPGELLVEMTVERRDTDSHFVMDRAFGVGNCSLM